MLRVLGHGLAYLVLFWAVASAAFLIFMMVIEPTAFPWGWWLMFGLAIGIAVGWSVRGRDMTSLNTSTTAGIERIVRQHIRSHSPGQFIQVANDIAIEHELALQQVERVMRMLIQKGVITYGRDFKLTIKP